MWLIRAAASLSTTSLPKNKQRKMSKPNCKTSSHVVRFQKVAVVGVQAEPQNWTNLCTSKVEIMSKSWR